MRREFFAFVPVATALTGSATTLHAASGAIRIAAGSTAVRLPRVARLVPKLRLAIRPSQLRFVRSLLAVKFFQRETKDAKDTKNKTRNSSVFICGHLWPSVAHSFRLLPVASNWTEKWGTEKMSS